MRIKVNDTVEIISGDDREVRGKVLLVDHVSRKVVVEGVNRSYKHVPRSQKNPQGGRLSREMPISMSNVKLVCSECQQPARVGVRYLNDGSKERFCRKCKKGIGQLAPPSAAYAKKK